MTGFTDQDFLKMIETEYGDVDWDNLPSLDSKPTYWKIDGIQHRRIVFTGKDGKQIKDKIGFGVVDADD